MKLAIRRAICCRMSCDFSQVRLQDEAPNRVRVSGARGLPPTAQYKT